MAAGVEQPVRPRRPRLAGHERDLGRAPRRGPRDPAKDLWLWPIPRGPRGRIGLGQYTGVYSIWKFAKNRVAAKRFLADLCIASSEAVAAANLFNYPSFPGAAPFEDIYATAAEDTHLPKGKYSILTTVAAKHTTNAGFPGHTTAAVQEVLESYLVPRMFAQVAQGKMSAADAVRAAAREQKNVWARWKKAGKV